MADVTEARKASVAKKKDTGKQLTIEAALAGKRDDLVHSSSESSDNETDWFLVSLSLLNWFMNCFIYIGVYFCAPLFLTEFLCGPSLKAYKL